MNIITLGKRLIPAEQIACVESFDPAANPDFAPGKDFKGRLLLINREQILTEQTPEQFAEAWGFRILKSDSVALNPWATYRVETFSPTETFVPQKPYQTRIKWRDLEGNEQSKLLLTDPETVLKVIAGHDVEETVDKRTARRRARSRRRS
jgi:hypothetical protein